MATYGRTRYEISFFVNDAHKITFYSDIPPSSYAPGEYLYVYDWKDNQGRFVMTDGPYRIVRTDHSIDWEANEGWAVPERFFLYVYTVRAHWVYGVVAGIKTILSAFLGRTPRAQSPVVGRGGPPA